MISLVSFLQQHLGVVFHWSLRDSMTPQFFKTLLSILVNLSNAVIRIVLILLLISDSSNSFSRFLGTIPSATTIIGITLTLIFHTFFSSLARSKNFSLFHFILFSLCSFPEQQNSQDGKFSFFLQHYVFTTGRM